MTIAPAALLAIEAGTAALGAVTTIMASAGTASAQNQINNKTIAAQREADNENYAAINRMSIQEAENTSQQLREIGDETRAATSTARTSAGEAGVSGLSVNALLRDLYGDEARLSSDANMQLDRTVGQLNSEARGVRSGSQAAMNSLSPVEPVDFLTPLASAGMTGFQSWRKNFNITPRELG